MNNKNYPANGVPTLIVILLITRKQVNAVETCRHESRIYRQRERIARLKSVTTGSYRIKLSIENATERKNRI